MHIDALLAVRKKHHWTQAELGKALMVSARTVRRWENGETMPPLYIMSALRELLDD